MSSKVCGRVPSCMVSMVVALVTGRLAVQPCHARGSGPVSGADGRTWLGQYHRGRNAGFLSKLKFVLRKIYYSLWLTNGTAISAISLRQILEVWTCIQYMSIHV